MQDQEDLRKTGGRYVVNDFGNGVTWSILDTETHLVYALMLTKLSNFIFQVDLVELLTSACSPAYLSYLKEIMSCRVEVSEPSAANALITWVLDELDSGTDVANPIEIATRLGADLHGQRVAWPQLKNML